MYSQYNGLYKAQVLHLLLLMLFLAHRMIFVCLSHVNKLLALYSKKQLFGILVLQKISTFLLRCIQKNPVKSRLNSPESFDYRETIQSNTDTSLFNRSSLLIELWGFL